MVDILVVIVNLDWDISLETGLFGVNAFSPDKGKCYTHHMMTYSHKDKMYGPSRPEKRKQNLMILKRRKKVERLRQPSSKPNY